MRVWATDNPEKILKKDHPALGGAVKDIDWTSDNQRLVVVGEGREWLVMVPFFSASINSFGCLLGRSLMIG